MEFLQTASDAEFREFIDSIPYGDAWDDFQNSLSGEEHVLLARRLGNKQIGETEFESVAGAFGGRLAFEVADAVADEIPYFGRPAPKADDVVDAGKKFGRARRIILSTKAPSSASLGRLGKRTRPA